jgi:hypothetical protein
MRTHVRRASVRPAAYLANTCSPQRTDPSLRSARSVLFAWPARSCCSRTTMTSTGRSTRTRFATRTTRTERRCAEGQRQGAPASFVMPRSTASLPWLTLARSRRSRCGSRTAARDRDRAARARSIVSSYTGSHGALKAPSHVLLGEQRWFVERSTFGFLQQCRLRAARARTRTTTSRPKAARLSNKPAASYSPRPLRAKYHRR